MYALRGRGIPGKIRPVVWMNIVLDDIKESMEGNFLPCSFLVVRLAAHSS